MILKAIPQIVVLKIPIILQPSLMEKRSTESQPASTQDGIGPKDSQSTLQPPTQSFSELFTYVPEAPHLQQLEVWLWSTWENAVEALTRFLLAGTPKLRKFYVHQGQTGGEQSSYSSEFENISKMDSYGLEGEYFNIYTILILPRALKWS